MLALEIEGYEHNWDVCQLYKVDGDLMSPVLLNNDEVIIDASLQPANNQITAFLLNGSFIIGLYQETDTGIQIGFINPEYDSLKILNTDEIEIIGVCIESIRSLI